MRSKKAVGWIIPLIYGLVIIAILVLLVIFAFRISAVVLAILTFLRNYWWLPLTSIILIFYGGQILGIFKLVFKKIGII